MIDLDAIEARHVQNRAPEEYADADPGWCNGCGQDWPCDIPALLARIRALEAREAALREAAVAVVDWAQAMQCKWCLAWAGSLFSHHEAGCPVGALGALLSDAPVAAPDLEYMCPNCVTPWKCNGPHIAESDAPVAEETPQ